MEKIKQAASEFLANKAGASARNRLSATELPSASSFPDITSAEFVATPARITGVRERDDTALARACDPTLDI